ncbi:hypothetical protein ES705_43068 [subsurface metagenome]
MSLRTLAKKTGIDPSNLSKIERGVAYPPKKKETLQKLAQSLDLDGDAERHFYDLAAQVNGMFPDDLELIKQNEAIPLLLRTIQNRRITYRQTMELANLVAQENNWQGRVVD